jgi:hypothetical protein
MIDKENKIALILLHSRDDFNANDFAHLKRLLNDKTASCVVFCDNSKAGQYLKVTFDKEIMGLVEENNKDFLYINVYGKEEEDKHARRQFIIESIYENLVGEYSMVLHDTDKEVAEII